MSLVTICAVVSSLSFLTYAYSYFTAPHMKNEFKRFGLEKLGLTTVILQIVGALGLLIGLKFNMLLLISSLGLAVLMFAGVLVRIKLRDSIWVSFPAFFFMVLNAYIFWETAHLL